MVGLLHFARPGATSAAALVFLSGAAQVDEKRAVKRRGDAGSAGGVMRTLLSGAAASASAAFAATATANSAASSAASFGGDASRTASGDGKGDRRGRRDWEDKR
jgi:hypothetical protein